MRIKSLVASLLALGALSLGISGATSAQGSRAMPIDRIPSTDAVPAQASCGDNRCSPPEDCNTCPEDCGRCCGDYRCAPPEDCNSCPQDCGPCR
ncbi:MAG: hypothetical protein K1X94_11035 [Sandaracinaceae bacterium]|nr:hypothetical protein [Sandaracinaceae bacterium]